jgi:acetyl-CoA carboxylase biotin carboxyl carrier protein
MTAEPAHEGEREQVLEWVVRHAARLGQAGSAPLHRITVSTATVRVEVEWSKARTGPRPRSDAGGDQSAYTAVPPAEETGPQDAVVLTAPMVGTFYRAQEPGARPFVEVGDVVEAGQQVGIIEAMKLMNAVQAEQGGRVTRIVAADGAPVQYEEPLLALVPHAVH